MKSKQLQPHTPLGKVGRKREDPDPGKSKGQWCLTWDAETWGT